MREHQPIDHLDMTIEWCDWIFGQAIQKDKIPNRPGVYEVMLNGGDERLTIGRTDCLRRRLGYLRTALRTGSAVHSAGRRIHAGEDVADVIVRWAVCERYIEVERELHTMHIATFGHLPRYTKRT